MRKPASGGGWPAIWYTLKKARASGGFLRMWRALNARNACKTCALGMGGQQGGMRNEAGRWPEVCKKSLQAMVADMQKGLEPEFFARYSIAQLRTLSPRELEWCGRLTAPLYAGPDETHYRVIAWDEALDRVARQMRARLGGAPLSAAFTSQSFAAASSSSFRFLNSCLWDSALSCRSRRTY